MNKEFLTYLMTLVTESRQRKIYDALKSRTSYITIVLEDLFQDHNISAALRSAEIFGVQNVHVIEQKNTYSINSNIARGAAQWLTMHRHPTTRDALQLLKSQGYTIAATVPDAHAKPLESLSLDTKVALIFGTEYAGLSKDALELADTFVTIPMFGFTQSLNVSVSAALCLHSLINRLHQSTIAWHLTDTQKEDLFFEWICKSVKHFEQHKRYFFNRE